MSTVSVLNFNDGSISNFNCDDGIFNQHDNFSTDTERAMQIPCARTLDLFI